MGRLAQWFKILGSFGPLILSFIPGLSPTIMGLVIEAIQTVEAAMGAGSGAAKKAAVLQGVVDSINVLNAAAAAAGKPPVADAEAVRQQLSGTIDLIILVVNAVHRSTPAVPAAPAPPAA